MQAMDDMALLREYAANNSETAFAELVSRRVNFVYSSALRQVRDPQLAGEITQAVFIILAQKAGRISDKTILTGWFFRTTRFAALAQIRAEAKRRRRELEVQMQSEFQSPAADEIWNQMSPLLDEALAVLGEKDRQAVLLRFFENKSLAEIGNKLGMSEDTARKRVSRALEKLHRYFAKRGVTSTAATIAEKISANSVQAAPVALAKSVAAVAIAKGAAASASTLTLIKGALKIMAWTKAKAAIVTGVSLLLATGTTATLVLAYDEGFNPHSADAIYEKLWSSLQEYTPVDVASLTAILQKAPPILIVRPTHYPGGGGGIVKVGGDKGFAANMPVLGLIQIAYDCPPMLMVLPNAMPDGRYDLMQTLPVGQNATALREEIKKQFGLIAHKEVQQTNVLLMEVKDPGKLQSHLSKESKDGQLVEIGKVLERAFDTPIVDRTALTNRYSLNLHFSLPANSNKLEAERTRQSIRDQLDQVGLELVPSREPIEMLVVEKVK
jgi:uncharacterized protein (TIGR03435 family)